jgi:hypothetical protein
VVDGVVTVALVVGGESGVVVALRLFGVWVPAKAVSGPQPASRQAVATSPVATIDVRIMGAPYRSPPASQCLTAKPVVWANSADVRHL